MEWYVTCDALTIDILYKVPLIALAVVKNLGLAEPSNVTIVGTIGTKLGYTDWLTKRFIVFQ